MRKRALYAMVLLCCGCSNTSAPIYYWPTKVPPPPGAEIMDHPCGHAVVFDSMHVPSADSSWMQAQIIYELDRDGKIVKSWRTPADYFALSLDGENLVIGYGSSPMYVLRLDNEGRLRSATPPEVRFESKACPAAFEKPEYFCISASPTSTHFLASLSPCS